MGKQYMIVKCALLTALSLFQFHEKVIFTKTNTRETHTHVLCVLYMTQTKREPSTLPPHLLTHTNSHIIEVDSPVCCTVTH